MPQITRIRFCHVGYDQARIDDLLLDFRTPQDLPIDTVLWLRNGGGKSTILRLVFALLRPNLRELFGSKVEQNLEGIIQADIPGVVIVEWRLNRESPGLYLTGVFYEKNLSALEPLRRLFFAARVISGEPRLTIENLPLVVETDGRSKHRTLSSFKQEWHTIGQDYPNAELKETYIQGEWERILDAAGIDPELFGYQIQMNHREGGAADLFKFQDIDEFVDFFLKLTINPSSGNQISSNLEKLREQLRRRDKEFIPEQELIQGMLERLEPLIGLHEKRETIDDAIALIKLELDHFIAYLQHRNTTLRENLTIIEQQKIAAQQKSQSAKAEATLCQQRSIFYRYLTAEKQVQHLESEYEKLSKQIQIAKHDEAIWKAAVPLQEFEFRTQTVLQLQQQIEELEDKHKPLLTKLKTAAQQYKATLLAKLKNLHKNEEFYARTQQEKQQAAITLRDTASQYQQEAAVLEEQAKQIITKMDKLARSLSKLKELGIIHADENWSSARKRIAQQQALKRDEQELIQNTLIDLDWEVDQVNEKISNLIRIETRASASESEIKTKLETVQIERQAIEQDEAIQRYLELEEIDLDRLDKGAINQLRQVERAIEKQVLYLWSGLLEQTQTLKYLQANELLPPSQDVQSVLDLLNRHDFNAWSGWKFISENLSSQHIREFIQRSPQTVTGVVIQHSHYEKAKQILTSVALNLSTPIVIADQEAILDNQAEDTILVIGPTSDAYFNRHAGQLELNERQAKFGQEHQNLDARKQELINLRASIVRLDRFRQQYSEEWIQEQRESINRAITQQQDCKTELAKLEGKQHQLKREIASQHEQEHLLMQELATLQEYLARLQDYSDQFPVELTALQENYRNLSHQAIYKKKEAHRCIQNAEESEQQAKEASEQVQKTVKQIGNTEDTLSSIKYCEEDVPVPKAGNVQMLCDSYNLLVRSYETKAGAAPLKALFDQAKQEQKKAQRKLSGKLQEERIKVNTVRTALHSLPDGDDVEQRYEEAMNIRLQIEMQGREKKAEVDDARQKLTYLEQECTQQNLKRQFAEEKIPTDQDQLGFKANEEELHSQTLEAIVAQQIEIVHTTELRQGELERQIRTIDNELEKIKLIVSSYETVLQIVQHRKQDFSWPPPPDAEIEARLKTLQPQLKQADIERKELDSTSHSVKQAIQKWIDQCQSKHGNLELVQQLKLWLERDYERECANLQNQLTSRLQNVRSHLTDLNRHRDEIVKDILMEALEGLRILSKLQTRSKLPPSLPHFGEKTFLKISLNTPNDSAEKNSRVEELVDGIVHSNKVPSGMELIQQAVRRLAQPIRIEILFPDLDLTPKYIPITYMKNRSSGGEHLTSAILLYCTLVRLRAGERGDRLNNTSTLLLDNPIGTASRPKLLKLQLEVAQSMNVQLIYTTAVEDFEALSIFPKLIRLRNERYDPLTGEKLLEIGSENGSFQSSELHLLDR